jgi:hypothetical protein
MHGIKMKLYLNTVIVSYLIVPYIYIYIYIYIYLILNIVHVATQSFMQFRNLQATVITSSVPL